MARTAAHRARPVAVAVLGSALTLAGCSVANPITTQEEYNASDGVRVGLGDGVSVENLMVITEGEGEEGVVLGSVVNRSQEDVEVTLAFGDGGGEFPVEVAANDSVNLTEADITVDSVEAPPGAVLPSTVSTDASGDHEVPVPVLDGTLPEYEEFLSGS